MPAFSYRDFFEIWRFEEDAALMEKIKAGAIVFFDEKQSRALYAMFVSLEGKHLMQMGGREFSNQQTYAVSFDDKASAAPLFARFKERARPRKPLLLFLSSSSAMLVEFKLLHEHWQSLLWLADEAMIAVDVDSRTVLLEVEERFFIAEIHNPPPALHLQI